VKDETIQKEENLKLSTNANKIHIIGSNWSIAADQWWCSGSGSQSEPYIIQDLVIDGQDQYDCIIIENSTAYFRIENCTLSNIGSLKAGIKLVNTTNGLLINNTCISNFEGGNYGIYLFNECGQNQIIGNNISNFENGIYLLNGPSENVIEDNYIHNNFHGIRIQGSFSDYCEDNNLTNNIVFNNSIHGMWFTRIRRTLVDNNAFYNNSGYAINSGESFFDTISNNILLNNSNGIQITLSNGSVISDNYIQNGTVNLFIGMTTYDCIIKGNRMYGGDYGIRSSAWDCNFTDNIIRWHSTCGFQILDKDHNYIYKNYFMDNVLHAEDQGIPAITDNYWNNTEIGNYWDNHSTTDADSNGIDDNKYTYIWGIGTDWMPIYGNPFHNGSAIHIDGDGSSGITWQYASTRNWCSGWGTENNPYVIKDLVINGYKKSNCLEIEDSNVHFRIEDCTLMTDHITYTLYFTALILHPLLIRRQLIDIFSYRAVKVAEWAETIA